MARLRDRDRALIVIKRRPRFWSGEEWFEAVECLVEDRAGRSEVQSHVSCAGRRVAEAIAEPDPCMLKQEVARLLLAPVVRADVKPRQVGPFGRVISHARGVVMKECRQLVTVCTEVGER